MRLRHVSRHHAFLPFRLVSRSVIPMSVPAGFLTCYCLGFRRRDPPSAFVGSDDPGSDDSGSDDSVFRHLWRFRRPTTLFLPFALYSWTLSLPLSQSLPNRLSINPNAPFHAAPMQPPWWNSVAIIGETSLTHRQVSRETTGETFHGTTWAVPQIVLRNNLSCSTNRSAKRSATIAQGSMPKSVEKRTGASHNNHVIRVYPYRSPHTPFYARHHTGRRPDHHAPHYTCYANAPHAPSRTSPCKCATQTGHTLAAAQTHHTHCYACHRTRTIAHARHHTRSPPHKPTTQAHHAIRE